MKIRFRSIKAIEEFLDIVNRFSAEIDIKSKGQPLTENQ